MSDLVVLIPTRGRPGAVQEIMDSFFETCQSDTRLMFVVDSDDPSFPAYKIAVRSRTYTDGIETYPTKTSVRVAVAPTNMVGALNSAARYITNHVQEQPRAIAFMGDDHRPRTPAWDTWYLEALKVRPGFVYGDDLYQGRKLPTQVAISTSVVQALGHMAPDVLTHLYVDDYWKALGTAADCITYLPDIVVEHLHPAAGKAAWDEGYRRVNDREMYEHDGAAYGEYMHEHLSRDLERVKFAIKRERDHGDQHV